MFYTKFILSVALVCSAIVSRAQNDCGISADFYWQNNPNNVPVFYDSTSVADGWEIISYHWDFGDGATSTQENPSHAFSQPGVYNVCHTVTAQSISTGETCIDEYCIPYTNCNDLMALFTWQTNGGVIVFISTANTGGGSFASYAWNFGDGTLSDVGPTVDHFYQTPGIYLVCLTVTSINGCESTFCQQVQVQSTFCTGIEASFIATSGTGTIAVQSTSTSGPNALFYQWVLNGNPTPFAPTSSSYSWSNLEAGEYEVCLNVASSNTALICDTYCETIDVTGNNDCEVEVVITSDTNPNGVTILQANATGGTAPYQYVWSNGASNSSILTVNTQGTYCVTVTDSEQCSASDCYYVSPAMDTLCGYIFNDLNGNGIFNENEQGIANATIQIGNYTAVTNADGYWQAIVPSGTYYIYYCAGTGNIITTPFSSNTSGTNSGCANYYGVLSSSASGDCNFNFGVQLLSVNICGKVFFDENESGTFDSNTESGLNAVQVIATSSTGSVFQTYTNTLGNYCIYLPAGEYVLTLGGNAFSGCVISPAQISITGTQGQSYSNQNFAVQCEPGSCNLAIDVYPSTTVTPGFPAWYTVYVCNQGTTVASGTANYFYNNSVLTLNYSSPAAASHNASTGHITWNINNLLPGQCTSFYVNFSSPTSTSLGSSVFTLAGIDANCNDYNLGNNIDSLHQIVVGSWDPNNKLAYQTNHDSNTDYQWISSIEANQRIEYVINFQNTGSAPAHNVVVEDFISEDLDMSTLEVLGASHPMQTIINGNDVNFRFNNIMLPDSTNNELESHGFVRFAINAVSGLNAGHIISDDAAIYFDFNEPIITNDAAVEMLNVVSVDEFKSSSNILVYPNPMEQSVQFKNMNGHSFRLRITDATGRVLTDKQSTSDVYTMERGSLASGFYFYEVIEAGVVSSVGKLVVR